MMTQHPCHWLKLVTRASGFREEALGAVGLKSKNPEYHQCSTKNQGELGREETTRFKTAVPLNQL
jgi:hypothetical protein